MPRTSPSSAASASEFQSLCISTEDKAREGVMSLADRLKASTNRHANTATCQTCVFFATLSDKDRKAIHEWITAGYNMTELHRECIAEGLVVARKNFLTHFANNHESR